MSIDVLRDNARERMEGERKRLTNELVSCLGDLATISHLQGKITGLKRAIDILDDTYRDMH